MLHLRLPVVIGLADHAAQEAVDAADPVIGQEVGLVRVHQAVLAQDGLIGAHVDHPADDPQAAGAIGDLGHLAL